MTITFGHLGTSVTKARSAAGDLWTALREHLSSSDLDLAVALDEHFAIKVLSDAAVRESSVLSTSGPDGEIPFAWVVHEGAKFLISGDPWHPAMTSALRRQPDGSIALARPGQLQLLLGEAPKTPSLEATALRLHEGLNTQDASGALSVVDFVDQAIKQAYHEGASDIHFESDRGGLGVKFRIDGVMCGGPRMDRAQKAEEVISRIKVMSQLDITERRVPQDGRIRWETRGHPGMDLRVSIMPSIFGEDAVLRLLDRAQLRRAQETISLGALGFEESVAQQIGRLARRPHGMLLVTGPTGSGKTTTVYAAMTEANNGLEKIVTIEDPVEYELPGVLQIPVNEQKGMTFATGLRSILRHDPDKILVGEIRDAETAEIAIQSALTGHLVMTTVHANSLFDVLGRFQHFDIDPFGLASALNGVVVQRLLRRLCPHCASSRAPREEDVRVLGSYGLERPSHIPSSVGCSDCRQTGYKGRLVVAEVHEVDDRVRDLIVRRASIAELREAMYAEHADTLLKRALAQVLAGRTTLEEISRVVG